MTKNAVTLSRNNRTCFFQNYSLFLLYMDQTTGTTPPATDAPAAPGQETPATGETSTPTAPTTPPTDPAAPSGPPPLGETPVPPTPAGTPAVPSPETPSDPAPDPSVAAGAPTAPTAPTDTLSGDQPQPATPPPAETHEEKKSLSKPLMVVVGLLVVGALSAVFLVSNMQTGDTQSSAHVQNKPPALPTQANADADTMMQMQKDPHLMIMSPTPDATVTTAAVTVSGKTFPNADVFVDEQELKADAKGMFSTTVTLDEGENSILVTANDDDGNDAEQEIMVTYEPEE